MSQIEPPLPQPDDLSGPFWTATREQRLVIQWCSRCDRGIHYPRHACPSCMGDDLTWREASGDGVVHAVTVLHVAAAPWMADRTPYVVALIDLVEGVRMLSNIDTESHTGVAVGQRVRVSWRELSDGRHLPQFAPSEST